MSERIAVGRADPVYPLAKTRECCVRGGVLFGIGRQEIRREDAVQAETDAW